MNDDQKTKLTDEQITSLEWDALYCYDTYSDEPNVDEIYQAICERLLKNESRLSARGLFAIAESAKFTLAVVVDLYSRKVIGWAMNKHMKASLVCDALSMALTNRSYPKGVIMHTDRGRR